MSPKESEKITAAYKQEHKRMLGYIRKRIPVSVEAEDILQDIFYQLTVGFNDIRRIENLTAWLYKVADNVRTIRAEQFISNSCFHSSLDFSWVFFFTISFAFLESFNPFNSSSLNPLVSISFIHTQTSPFGKCFILVVSK